MNNLERVNIMMFGDFGHANPESIRMADDLKRIVRNQDIVAVNFEGCINHGKIISPTGRPVPQSEVSATWCRENGINMFVLSNNHIMDYGTEGIKQTLTTFAPEDVVIGVGRWNEVYKIQKITIRGITIGFISGTSCDFSALKSQWDDKDKIGCAWINSPEFIKCILAGVNQCDYLFVIAHAGVEFLDIPLPEFRDLYRFWIDLGASGVIASHPHVPQGLEVYKDRPIYYSLGNFIFQGSSKNKERPQYWRNSVAARLSLGISDLEFDFIPIEYSEIDNLVKIDDSPEAKAHIELLNTVLRDDKEYRKVLDAELPKFARKFESFILSSANAIIVEPSLRCLKSFLAALLKGNKNQKALLHQFREEATVNTIKRSLKSKSNTYL